MQIDLERKNKKLIEEYEDKLEELNRIINRLKEENCKISEILIFKISSKIRRKTCKIANWSRFKSQRS